MTLSIVDELVSDTELTSGQVDHTTAATLDPPDDSFLVAHCGIVNGAGEADVRTGMTLSGGGLTWTKRAGPNGGTTAGYTSCHEVWTAPFVSGSAFALNYVHAGDVGDDRSVAMIQVQSFVDDAESAGLGGTPNIISEPANGDDGAQTINLPSAGASDSYKTCSRYYSSNGSDVLAQVGTGWTESYDAVSAAGGYGSLQSQYILGETDDTITWDDIAAGAPATAWNSSGIGLEIEIIVSDALTASGTPPIESPVAVGVAFRTDVKITDVSTDEAWDDGDTGIPITGTGFV